MEAPERGALMLVRFVAVTLIGWSFVELALYVVICHHQGLPVGVLPVIIRSLPCLTGVVTLIKSRALAAWLAEQLDL
jgi:hypothetical protein